MSSDPNTGLIPWFGLPFPAPGAEWPLRVHPVRVFLVEDETLILMMTADMLESFGHEVIAEASTVEKAASLAKTADYDIAVHDVAVAGARIDPIVDIVSRRNLPFVFVTGYSDTSSGKILRPAASAKTLSA